jgi:hypothetical protein
MFQADRRGMTDGIYHPRAVQSTIRRQRLRVSFRIKWEYLLQSTQRAESNIGGKTISLDGKRQGGKASTNAPTGLDTQQKHRDAKDEHNPGRASALTAGEETGHRWMKSLSRRKVNNEVGRTPAKNGPDLLVGHLAGIHEVGCRPYRSVATRSRVSERAR